ncbi:hypothetical protein L1049_020320 [Liquidambar formosana]|uniref:BHLH domain-containing protein n=1 Tax=Liquidambar formosana TaxID=63359 RepID=A0AAP0SDT5_LIQFO
MNNHPPMFPFHQEDYDELFQISSTPHQEHKIQQDLFMGHASLVESNLQDTKVRPQKILATSDNNFEGNNYDDKKIKRKELERDRRQRVATLCQSLRSLLPRESVKGKCSVSDQINEAANYIKSLQIKIQELRIRRDELKKLSKSSSHGCRNQTSNINSPNCVMVRPYFCGVEIVISGGFREEGLPLSRVVEILLEEGLSVVSCVSTKANEGLFHTIQSEVSDLSVDLSGLQRKLTDVVNPSSR